VGAAQPDGIYFDPFNERVYVFSHPTKDATVIDGQDGTVLGKIDLAACPSKASAKACSTSSCRMRSSVTAVDVNTMKATGHYPFGDKGRCNGLALDAKRRTRYCSLRARTREIRRPRMSSEHCRTCSNKYKPPLAEQSFGYGLEELARRFDRSVSRVPHSNAGINNRSGCVSCMMFGRFRNETVGCSHDTRPLSSATGRPWISPSRCNNPALRPTRTMAAHASNRRAGLTLVCLGVETSAPHDVKTGGNAAVLFPALTDANEPMATC